jgi:hypothetical protein
MTYAFATISENIQSNIQSDYKKGKKKSRKKGRDEASLAQDTLLKVHALVQRSKI